MKARQPATPPRRTVSVLLGAFLLGGLAGRHFMHASDGHSPPLQDDAALVKSLLGEILSGRTFDFATIAEACSGKRVLPLTDEPAHLRVTTAIGEALADTLQELKKKEGSPVRNLRRINEASRFFEDGPLARLNATPGLRCKVPTTRAGINQRSGYPDLRITEVPSGAVFYLDPKLV